MKAGKVVTRCPEARREFLAEKIVSRGEAFETDLAVPIVLEPHHVEIVLSARNRKIGAPPILDALEFDEMSDLEATDLVGPTAKRDVEGRFVERFFRIVGARKDRQPGDEQRHVACAILGKARDNGAIIDSFCAREVAQLLGNDRVALVLQCGERPGDIMCRQRRAVMEFRFRTQRESVGQPVIGNANAARGQAIHRIGLVARADHQRRERKLHPLRSIALENKAVERIEGLERLVELAVRSDLREHPAFRRIRIDVVEMRKIRRVTEIAEGRHAVPVAILRSGGNDAAADTGCGRTGKKLQSTATTEHH